MIAPIDEKKKEKDLALKVSTHNNDGHNDEDEEIALLSRKFKQSIFGRKGGIANLPSMILMIVLESPIPWADL